jgi:hypothetical protein
LVEKDLLSSKMNDFLHIFPVPPQENRGAAPTAGDARGGQAQSSVPRCDRAVIYGAQPGTDRKSFACLTEPALLIIRGFWNSFHEEEQGSQRNHNFPQHNTSYFQIH